MKTLFTFFRKDYAKRSHTVRKNVDLIIYIFVKLKRLLFS